jgi:hypothetical protein
MKFVHWVSFQYQTPSFIRSIFSLSCVSCRPASLLVPITNTSSAQRSPARAQRGFITFVHDTPLLDSVDHSIWIENALRKRTCVNRQLGPWCTWNMDTCQFYLFIKQTSELSVKSNSNLFLDAGLSTGAMCYHDLDANERMLKNF